MHEKKLSFFGSDNNQHLDRLHKMNLLALARYMNVHWMSIPGVYNYGSAIQKWNSKIETCNIPAIFSIEL